MRKCLLGIMFSLSLSLFRVLRDNPLVCSCDLHWLQQWQLTDRGDVNSQMLSCLSGDQYVPLSTLIIDNCSELVSSQVSGPRLTFDTHILLSKS